MPALARKGDPCTGHGCFPPRPSTSGSPNVFINGIPALRETDTYDTHCCGPSCHSSQVATGSSTVNINGLPAARVGDPVACGSVVAVGSVDVIVG